MSAINLAVRQGSDAWLEARRSLVTATAIPILMGLSPYRCEADLADEMMGGPRQDATIRMRVGKALEGLIGEAYTEQTGRAVRRYHGMLVHPELPWAAASPDFRVVGERRLMEAKRYAGRGARFEDGLPQDIEAQVAWQLGVSGYPAADVAVLMADDELKVFPQEANPTLFANLVTVAEDFRRRLAAGGPFAKNADRVKRDYPADNGAEMLADEALEGAVLDLSKVRAERKRLAAVEEDYETAIKDRMREFSVLRGQGWHVTWKRTKDSTSVDWKSVADGLLRQLPETERDALVGIGTTVRQGFRPMRVVFDKED